MSSPRQTLEFPKVRSTPSDRHALPDIEIHGCVEISFDDLAAYERATPASAPELIEAMAKAAQH